jgi:hypothetical protein
VPEAPETIDVHEALDAHLHFTAKGTLDLIFARDYRTNFGHLFVRQITYALVDIDARRQQNLLRAGPADAVNIGQSYFGTPVLR